MQLINKFEVKNCIMMLGENSNVVKLLNCFDTFVMSSNSEAFPNALGEAMSMEVPCISTDVGDVSYIIGQKNFLFNLVMKKSYQKKCMKL